jgi:hypothetical protein
VVLLVLLLVIIIGCGRGARTRSEYPRRILPTRPPCGSDRRGARRGGSSSAPPRSPYTYQVLELLFKTATLFFGGMLQSPGNINEESGLLVCNIVKR